MTFYDRIALKAVGMSVSGVDVRQFPDHFTILCSIGLASYKSSFPLPEDASLLFYRSRQNGRMRKNVIGIWQREMIYPAIKTLSNR